MKLVSRLPARRIAARLAWSSTVALALATPAFGEVWTNVNPGGGGAFTCAGAGRTGIILVGSDIGGLYRSDDDGASWENVGWLNGGVERCYISAVAFDADDGSLVHMGIDGGLYRSADGGRTFSVKASGGFWSAIAVSFSNPAVVYAAKQSAYNSSDPTIWKSLNRGLSWSQVGVLPAGTRVIRMGVNPIDPARLFALSGWEKLVTGSPRRALYVSGDGGASWTDAHGDSTGQGMTGNPWDAAYDPLHPDTLFATSVEGSGNVDETPSWSGRTWRGSQAGGQWSQVSAHTGSVVVREGSGEVLTVDVRRDGPGCTECGPWTSTDFGASWTRQSDMTGWDTGWQGSVAWGYNGSFTGVGKTLRQDLSDDAVVLWVTPQFVWRSCDWGTTFTSLFSNPSTPGFWSGRGINNVAPTAVSASDSMLYTGYYDLGIWRSLDGGASWQSSNDPALTGAWAGKGGNCMTILADPVRPDVVWASQGESMASARVVRSTSAGAPGSWTAGTGIPQGFISGLALDPKSPPSSRTLYVSSNGDVYKTMTDGAGWSQTFGCDSCYTTAANDNVIFTGGQRGLWRSLNGGLAWSELAPATFHLGLTAYGLTSAKWNGPHDIVISGPFVYVAVYGKNRGLYRSTNSGTTWTRLVADDYALDVEIDALGSIYLGSSSASNAGGAGTSGATGIRVSRDHGTTWSSLSAGLPWPFVWPIESQVESPSSIRLFVGSPGSGFWTTVTGTPVAVGDGGPTAFMLAGFRPNPARERISVAFSLPSREPAVLEIFDVAGRRVLRRDVTWLGAGTHVLPLEPGFRPVPGLYALRLAQGGRVVKALSTVVR